MNAKIMRPKRYEYKAKHALDFGEVNGVEYGLAAGKRVEGVPLEIGEWLVKHGHFTKDMSFKPNNQSYQPFTEVKLPFKRDDFIYDQDEVRVRALCLIEWSWFTENEIFDGDERLLPGRVRYLRKDIAKVVVDAGAAELCPWPIATVTSAPFLDKQHRCNAGFFIKTNDPKLLGPKEINTALRNDRPGVLVEVGRSESTIAWHAPGNAVA